MEAQHTHLNSLAALCLIVTIFAFDKPWKGEALVPDACQSFRDEVNSVKLSLAELQDELRHASPAEKPGLIKLIRETTKELAQANVALATCEHDHPPSVVEFTTATCPVCTPSQLNIWRRVVDFQLGVDAFDPVGHWIGAFPAERFGPINNWFPLAVEKQVLCGQLHHFDFFDGLGAEADWNNFIVPSPAFSHILEDPKALFEPNEDWHTCINQFDCLEAEITPDESYYENIFNSRQSDSSPLEGQNICTYGPWVRERLHSSRPEIHPSEMYWWRARLSDQQFYYMLMLVQDDSNRFDREEDFDFGAPWDGPPNNWRPWSADPRSGTFMIAFELNPTGVPLTFSIQSIESLRTDQVADDRFSERILRYNGRNVVTVQEVNPASSRVAISYGSVCRNAADNRLQGYVVLTGLVGQGDRGGEGYQTLRVDVNRPPLLHVDDAVIKAWPLLPTSESSARGFALQAVANSESLHRVERNGRAELQGDIEIRIAPAPGRTLTDQDQVVARAESIVDGRRRDLVVAPVAPATPGPRRSLLSDVPVSRGTRMELTTGSGITLAVASPPLTLAPNVTRVAPQGGEANPQAWDAFVAAAGGRTGALPPPAPLMRVNEWIVEVTPEYAPLRDGAANAEDESPFTEEINDAILRRDPDRLQDIFGEREPVSVKWEFTATDVTTGRSVPVRRGVGAARAAVRVTEQLIDSLTGRATINFPTQSGGKVYELIATAHVTDVFGFTGAIRQRISSHALTLDDRSRLVSVILPAAATLADVSPDDLLGSANLGAPMLLGEHNAPRMRDPRSSRAQMVRLAAMAAAEDQRIDLEDLRALIAGARLFGKTQN